MQPRKLDTQGADYSDTHASTSRLDELRQALHSRNTVLFAGAGVSIKCGLPDWESALKSIADQTRSKDQAVGDFMTQLIGRGDLIQAAGALWLSTIVTPKERLDIVRGPFSVKGDQSAAKDLVTLPFHAFVTTNFDEMIECCYTQSLGRHLTQFARTPADLKGALRHPGPYAMHLHGRVASPDTMVLCDRHYSELANDKDYETYLRQLVQDYSILFFGYSFRDPDIRLLLDYLAEHLSSNWARDVFAIVVKSEGELIAQLSRLNVKVIAVDSHDDAWSRIRSLQQPPRAPMTPTPADAIFESHLTRLQNSMAASLAHMELMERGSTLPDCVYAGIVATAITDVGGAAQPVQRCAVTDRIRQVLLLDTKRAEAIFGRAIALLETLDAVAVTDSAVALKKPIGTEKLDKVRKRLSKIIAARADVRLGYKLADAPEMGEFVVQLLAREGVGLAHKMLGVPTASRQGQHVEQAAVVAEKVLSRFSPSDREATLRTVLGMFRAPTKDEEELLAKLARCVFTTEIVLHEPTLSSLTGFGAVSLVYLDSNVLLPILLKSHPLHDFNVSLLSAARQHGIRTMVYSDFVNEVLQHRAIALETATTEVLGTPEAMRAYAKFWGSQWINAFLGAYAESTQLRDGMSFGDFLNAEAPYQSMPQLTAYLETQGINVVRTLPLSGAGTAMRLTQGLDSAYRALKVNKPEVLVRDEARQLAVLVDSVQQRQPCWFVTADRRLVRAVTEAFKHDKIWGSALAVMISPVEYAHFLELSGGHMGDWSGYARFILGMLSTDVLTRLLDNLTDQIVADYPFVPIEQIPRAIAQARADLSKRLTPDLEDCPQSNERERIQLFSIFNEYARGFYEQLQGKKRGLTADMARPGQ